MPSKYAFYVEDHEDFYRYPERSYLQPFCICGNLFYVGNRDAGSHLIDTGDGLILIDSTYPTTAALLVNSIWEAGFKVQDIRYILHSHGHFDHFGATALLKALSGAKTCLGAEDARMFRDQPELALIDCNRYAYLELFTPDVELKTGDIIRLGNTEIRILETPGHSPGTVSFFFEVSHGREKYTAGMFGGSGLNTLCHEFITEHHLTSSREQFLSSLARLRLEKVDIVLGNHAPQNNTVSKSEKLLAYPDGPNPFIDPSEWLRLIDTVQAGYERMLADEAAGMDQIDQKKEY